MDRGEVMLFSEISVLCAVGWGCVNDTSTVFSRDVASNQHAMRMVGEISSSIGGFIADVQEFDAAEGVEHLPALPKYAVSKHLSKHEALT